MVKRTVFNFSVILEILIWIFYVLIYKYSYYLEYADLPRIPNNDFPYLQICLFGICSTLLLIPYYRWAVPKLLLLKKYGWIFLISVVVFVFIPPYFRMMVAWILAWPTEGMVVHQFFKRELHFYIDWDLVMTDSIAFLCIAFSRFSYTNEQLRHKIETDHLQLQLSQLKAQLQPHFLFNTLNSLYGMSLSGSKETPRFILLLSQMMQYILYDCNSEEISLKEELAFLKGYFEIEQKKFPLARIELKVPEHLPDIAIPPLLFLPLVENSFKHGLHKLEDHAGVYATVHLDNKALYFSIENECLPLKASESKAKGGIGLNNIKKRLELYYPGSYTFSIVETPQKYVVNLTLNLS